MSKDKRIDALRQLAKDIMSDLPYHNYSHALDVYEAAMHYAKLEEVPKKDLILVGAAALLHDLVYQPKSKGTRQSGAAIIV